MYFRCTFDDVAKRHERFVDVFRFLEPIPTRFSLLGAFASREIHEADAAHLRRLRRDVVLSEVHADDGVGPTR